ncbi:MAG: SurA N-terminal domain-containing protein, partial [Chlamydiota bacterium]
NKLIFFSFFSFLCIGTFSLSSDEPKIAVQNTVLIQINGNKISVLDVMKKMDIMFYKNFPDMRDSLPARFQFYTNSWKHVLEEMINTELILIEAEHRELKVTDGEIREDMETRFGPNILTSLEKLGLSYDETMNMIKKDLIVKKMTGYFIHLKAMQSVHPELIRTAYSAYLETHPAFEEWTYQIISIQAPEEPFQKHMAEKVLALVQKEKKDPDTLLPLFKELEKNYPSSAITLSSEYKVTDKEVSANHKEILTKTPKETYSALQVQKNKTDGKSQVRIFYVKNHENHNPPAFNEMANNLKDELLQKAVADESEHYLSKLRKNYGYNDTSLKTALPEDFQPFKME